MSGAIQLVTILSDGWHENIQKATKGNATCTQKAFQEREKI